MIPVPEGTDGPVLGVAADADPVVQRDQAFFGLFDWSLVPERDPRRPWPGSPPHPKTTSVKALLVKLGEGKRFVTDLRTFLLEHPLLVRELGFRPVPDPTRSHGFDVGRTVPGARWLRHHQQTLAHPVLRALLAGTGRALAAEIPGLGTTVAVAVKHISAWVRENNPQERVPHRHDPARQPRGDPDCRLGAKCRTNHAGHQEQEFRWGDGTGLASATDPTSGDVVLADLTQPCNCQDLTSFVPVHRAAVAALGRHPTNLAAAACAACAAWHVDQPSATGGGLAAVPRNDRGPSPPRDPAGHPLCARGRTMVPTTPFTHEDGFRAPRDRCPLLRPQPTGATGDHAQFAKGPGCTTYTNLEAGGRMRAELDRRSPAYGAISRQRSSAERINSQAKALGIERPMVRTAAAVHRLNTRTDLVINARALHRARTRNATAAHPP